MDLSELQLYHDAAQAVAREAGKIIREAFYKPKNIMEKDDNAVDLVTETDQQCETLIKETLNEKFPTRSFIGEESTAAGATNVFTDNPTWIVDPLDGTTNFVHRFPYVAVCIALAINKEVQVGVVYNPILDEMFSAIRGQGSFMNSTRLQVSACKEVGKALIHTEVGNCRTDPMISLIRENYFRVAQAPCHSIRTLGAAAMNISMVARGASDAYWEFGVHAWDFAAASLIVTEAGGYCCDTSGGEMDLMSRRVVAASTPELAKALVALITDIPYYERD